MALALATAGIALAVNTSARLALDVPYVGMLLAFVVFVAGHVFNFAINILGSAVHSIRLHYVEFFRQFYNADGKKYVPFRISETGGS